MGNLPSNRCGGQPNGGGPGQSRLFERPPVFGYDLAVNTIGSDFTGGDIGTPWAKMRRMVSTDPFPNDIGLSGLVLATSILNPISELVGVFAVLEDASNSLDVIAVSKSVRCFIGHLTFQNSPAAGTPNPTNKSSSLSFGENSAIRVNSGQRISIFASGNNVSEKFAAFLTTYTIALDKR